ncbi:Conglutin beta [Thalictrum thalictroides]|uniref:Conglutin beta n=1 Tax=Thalictrum thalictroides TaxID=46969 RepID=A0A7J6X487_THATH|nr:Conglutin beta [Thalictrum thalictroides]
MAFRKLPFFVLFVLFVFFVSATFSLAYEKEQDPVLRICKEQCRTQPQYVQQKCERDCEEYVKEKQKREEGQGGKGGGAVIEDFVNTGEREDPQREYEQCQEGCRLRRWTIERQRRCLEECDEKRKQREQEQGRGRQEGGGQSEGEYESRQQGEDENPYLFHQEKFSSHMKSQEGNFQVLERFNKRSNLLQGIENYRIALLEINPNTFTVPNHWDADTICFVLSGRGAITLLQENNKETHNLERGDILRIRAGTIISVVNRDNKEKFRVAKLIQPVNVPGEFEPFFGPGGKNPESYYSAFSNEILEAAFEMEGDQVRKLFEGQNKGAFVKASQQQIKALSREQGIPWPFRHGESQSNKPYNMFNKERPAQSNKYGKLYVVSPDDYEQLQELDVQISYANITKGAMIGPYYNSRSIKITMVVNGNNGRFEMACPHLSQQQGQQGSQQEESREQRGKTSYQKVSGLIRRGDVYVTPAGHPLVAVASKDENLELLCFEINARYNHRYQLAGKNNILKQLQKVAKQLSFNVPAEQVEKIFDKQQESMFYPGPKQQQEQEQEQGGGGHADA